MRYLDQPRACFFACLYTRVEIDSQFSLISEQIESFAIDTGHHHTAHGLSAQQLTVVKQSSLVIAIHMLDYGFLCFAKRVLEYHRVRLDQEYPANPADEPRSSQTNPVERKIVCLEI